MFNAISSFLFGIPVEELEYRQDRELKIGVPLAIQINFEVITPTSDNCVNALTATIIKVMEWARDNLYTDTYYQVTGVVLENTALIFLIPFDDSGEDIPDGFTLPKKYGAAFYGSAISAIAARNFGSFIGNNALGNVTARIFELPSLSLAVAYLGNMRSSFPPVFIKCIDENEAEYECYNNNSNTSWPHVLASDTFENVEWHILESDEDAPSPSVINSSSSESSSDEEMPALIHSDDEKTPLNEVVSPPPSYTVLE